MNTEEIKARMIDNTKILEIYDRNITCLEMCDHDNYEYLVEENKRLADLLIAEETASIVGQ